ncbi:hypothetical protein V5799_007767 [Amblyomma americanum]|uniref:Secreted protein n=1 Tax=Amblyomma americanum TaxID=6943 RepID=A0AAQ4FF62_AMBAM
MKSAVFCACVLLASIFVSECQMAGGPKPGNRPRVPIGVCPALCRLGARRFDICSPGCFCERDWGNPQSPYLRCLPASPRG